MSVTPLDVNQIADIRGDTGDNCTGAYVVDDATLERWWQASGGVYCEVVIKVYRRLIADAQTKYDQGNRQSGEYSSRSQVAKAMEKNLEYWEQKCGMAGGIIESGTIDLGLEVEESELES